MEKKQSEFVKNPSTSKDNIFIKQDPKKETEIKKENNKS